MKNILLLTLLLASSIVHADLRPRSPEWALPIIGGSLENLYSLDEKVYRSEQPDEEGFVELEKFGIKDVLNLRNYHTDSEEAENTTIKLHQVKMNAGSISHNELIEALSIIKQSEGPILVHCWHGSDRTGAVSAAYRMVFQGWPKAKAIEELKEGGYGYHSKIYPNIVTTLETLDLDTIRQELGLVVEH